MKRPLIERLPNRTLLAMTGVVDSFRDAIPARRDESWADGVMSMGPSFTAPSAGRSVVVARRPMSRAGRSFFWAKFQLQLMLSAMAGDGATWEVWGEDEEEAKVIFNDAKRELAPPFPTTP